MAGYTDTYGDTYLGDPHMLAPPPPGGPQFAAGTRPHGNLATQDLNELITNPLSFCTAGILARIRQAAGTQPLSGAANNVIKYDTVDEDPYNGWSSSSYYWMPPAGASGWYHVCVTASVTYSTGAQMRTMISVTGSILYTCQQTGPRTPYIQSGATDVYLLGGIDYVQCQVYAYSSGLTTSITAGQQSAMDVAWVSN